MAFDKVDAHSVYTCTATPQPEDILAIMTWMLEKSIAEAYHRQ